jgi:hypothetical protein
MLLHHIVWGNFCCAFRVFSATYLIAFGIAYPMRPTGAELISVTAEPTRVSFGVCASFKERIKLTDIVNETDAGTGRTADVDHQNV